MEKLTEYFKDISPLSISVACLFLFYILYKNRSSLNRFIRIYVKGEELLEKEGKKKTTDDDKYKEIITTLGELKKSVDNNSESIKFLSDNLSKIESNFEESISYVMDKCDFLTISDREDKKAYITKEYNYYVFKVKKIDMFTLDTIEKIYDLYLKENGDTFVASMMSRIRELEVVPYINDNIFSSAHMLSLEDDENENDISHK